MDPSLTSGYPSENASPRLTWAQGLLLLAMLVQVGLLLQRQVVPLLRRVALRWQEPAIVRSAELAFGAEFSDYIQFLRSRVPADATVVIPRDPFGSPFAHVGIKPIFLIPREIVNCRPGEQAACVQSLGGSGTYLLAPDSSFPPRQALPAARTFVSFKGERGYFSPPVR